MKHKILLIIILFAFNNCTVENDNISIDNCDKCKELFGIEVKIGKQIWMTKNLDVDHYRNGDSIPECKDANDWMIAFQSKIGVWCYYNNDIYNGKIFGKLYNWYAVNDTRGLAPDGWHIPSENEWNEFEQFLSNATGLISSDLGGVLKSIGTSQDWNGLWFPPNLGATNEFCFSALPGGYRHWNGGFDDIGLQCALWSSSENDTIGAWHWMMVYDRIALGRYGGSKVGGFSVRCVKD